MTQRTVQHTSYVNSQRTDGCGNQWRPRPDWYRPDMCACVFMWAVVSLHWATNICIVGGWKITIPCMASLWTTTNAWHCSSLQDYKLLATVSATVAHWRTTMSATAPHWGKDHNGCNCSSLVNHNSWYNLLEDHYSLTLSLLRGPPIYGTVVRCYASPCEYMKVVSAGPHHSPLSERTFFTEIEHREHKNT